MGDQDYWSNSLTIGVCKAQVTLRRTGGGTGNILPDEVTVASDIYDPSSPRQTFAHWEVPFIRWLEKYGYPVDYCTDLVRVIASQTVPGVNFSLTAATGRGSNIR